MVCAQNYENNNFSNIEMPPIWFSHIELKRKVERNLIGKKKIKWTDTTEWWDWDNCFVSAVKTKEEKIRIIIRSSKTIFSDYKKRNVKLKYMIGFDIDHIPELEKDKYHEPPEKNPNKQEGKLLPRWVLKLDEKHHIWQWEKNDSTLESVELAKIRKKLKNIEDEPYDPTRSNIFHVDSQQDDNRIIPVIYQPAIDSLKNFVREVHCIETDNSKIKVTLLFNNEHLTKHKYLDKIYRIIRLIVYRRTADIESFIINVENSAPEKFQFPGIYSRKNDMEQDDVHEDKPEYGTEYGNVPNRQIKYFFIDKNHPIVFINTANHAMSNHDTNHRLWKWEYIPWEDNGPVILGIKSRKEIESANWDIYSENWIKQYLHE
jgi:hypothetical protein